MPLAASPMNGWCDFATVENRAHDALNPPLYLPRRFELETSQKKKKQPLFKWFVQLESSQIFPWKMFFFSPVPCIKKTGCFRLPGYNPDMLKGPSNYQVLQLTPSWSRYKSCTQSLYTHKKKHKNENGKLHKKANLENYLVFMKSIV